jgi:hypothetical protein
LAAGESLNAICKDEDMPSKAAVLLWVSENRSGFSDQYARAREVGYEKMADELLEIADDGTNDFIERSKENGDTYTVVDQEHIARSRLRVETRKWLLSKMLPKVYGDKTTVGGDPDAPIQQVLRVLTGVPRHQGGGDKS